MAKGGKSLRRRKSKGGPIRSDLSGPGGLNAKEYDRWIKFKEKKIGTNSAPGKDVIASLFQEFLKEEAKREERNAKRREAGQKRNSERRAKGRRHQSPTTVKGFNDSRKVITPAFIKAYIPLLPDMPDEEVAHLAQTLISMRSTEAEHKSLIDEVLGVIRRVSLGRGGKLISGIGHNRYFKWPSTDVVYGTGHNRLRTFDWEKHGLLSYFGYSVGQKYNLPESERRRILDNVFRAYLLFDIPKRVREDWGPPDTAARLKKMAHAIASFARNFKRQKSRSVELAISRWQKDLDYLYTTYYVGRFGFAWPRIR